MSVRLILTDSVDAGAYWRKLKQRLQEEGNQSVTICHDLKLKASDGKKYKTDCANIEGIFRIIQSIPSPKAEPFKRWLAKIGKERLDEIMSETFGMTVPEYKNFKDIAKQNLRDHMNDLELILTMLAESTTTELHKVRDSFGFGRLHVDSHDGGQIAGRTRKDIEKQTGRPVPSKRNFLRLT